MFYSCAKLSMYICKRHFPVWWPVSPEDVPSVLPLSPGDALACSHSCSCQTVGGRDTRQVRPGTQSTLSSASLGELFGLSALLLMCKQDRVPAGQSGKDSKTPRPQGPPPRSSHHWLAPGWDLNICAHPRLSDLHFSWKGLE